MEPAGFASWPGGLSLLLFALILVWGLFPARHTSLTGFFLADRQVPILFVVFSLMATETGALGLLFLPGLVWNEGARFPFLQLALGYLLGRIIAGVWFLPTLRLGEPITPLEFLGQRFRNSVEQTAAGLCLGWRALVDGLVLYGAAHWLNLLLGVNVGWMMLALGLASVILAAQGGARRVVTAQALLWLFFLGILIAFLIVTLQKLPVGWTESLETWLSSGFGPHVAPNQSPGIRPEYDPPGVAALLAGWVLGWAKHGTDPLIAQRYFFGQSTRVAIGAMFLGALGFLAQILLLGILGLAWAALQSEGIWSPLAGTESFRVWIRFAQDALGPPWPALLSLATISVTIGFLSASCLSCSSVAMVNLIRSHFPITDSRVESQAAQWSTLGWGALQVVVAMAFFGLELAKEDFFWVEPIEAIIAGLILALFLLGWRERPPKSFAALASLMIAAGVAIVLWMPATWGRPMIGTPWIGPLVVGLTWILGLLLDPSRPKKKAA